MQLCIGGLFERVVLESHGGGCDPRQLVQLTQVAFRSAAAGKAVVSTWSEGGQHVGGIGEYQAVTVVVEFVEVEQPLFGGQALDKGQVTLPVLDAELPHLGLTGHYEGNIMQVALLAQGFDDGEW